MKNFFKLFGIIALVAVIGFSMVACGGGDDDGVDDNNDNNDGGSTSSLWTAITSPFDTTTINEIAYVNGKFIAGGNEGKMATSTDGITWTPVTGSPFEDARRVYAIAYGNNTYVAGGMSGKMWTSTDGMTWTEVANSGIESDIFAIAFGDNKFVAVGGGGGLNGRWAYSTDNGTTWTGSTTMNHAPNQINAIIFANNKFFRVTNSGGINYLNASNSWAMTSSTSFPFSGSGVGNQHINGIAYGDGKLVIGGTIGRIAVSTDDGANWTVVSNSTFSSTTTIRAIAYGNNKFIAVGDNGKMATSSDGTTWTALTPPSIFDGSNHLLAIAYGDNKFVAVSSAGNMAYLPD